MRDAAGRSRCFAFLTFEEPASVNAVMVREHFLDGKIVSREHYLAAAVLTSMYVDRPEKSHPASGTPARN